MTRTNGPMALVTLCWLVYLTVVARVVFRMLWPRED